MQCNQYVIPSNEKMTIGMLGGPSSGKDTLCDYISAILSNSNKKMTEIARDYIEKNGNLYSPFQERIIFDKIAEREKEVAATYQVVLSPGARILAYFYTAILTPANPNSAELDNLQDIYSSCIKAVNDYDYLFFCESLDYDEDGLRYQSEEENLMLRDCILNFLKLHKIPYVYLGVGSVSERSEKVLEVIGAQKIKECVL